MSPKASSVSENGSLTTVNSEGAPYPLASNAYPRKLSCPELYSPMRAPGDQFMAAMANRKLDVEQPIVVLTHRPLFPLYPSWDWSTKDGAAAIALLQNYRNVTVFYGHIHQEHHQMTGRIAHHSARSLIFPLPAPGSAPKRAPLPWDPAHPNQGLGYRGVDAQARRDYRIDEYSIA